MEEWIDYLTSEEGKEVIFTEKGLMAYTVNDEEFFISDFYISKKYRGSGAALEIAENAKKKAENLGCKIMTCNVFINEVNRESFGHKVRIFTKFGFIPTRTNNNAVTMIKEL